MNITQPGYYLERGGGKAKAVAIDETKAPSYRVIGWDSDGEPANWSINGERWTDENPDKWDLIEPWVDRPEWPTWPVPPWINWIAVNGHGNWFGYSTRPEPYGSIWVFSQPTASIEIPPAYKPIWTGDWTKSLIERPKQS